MEIEEVEAMIEESERLLNEADKERKKINKKKMTANQKAKMMEPFDAEIKMLRERIIFLVAQQDKKIPFYEKLPKDHQFYKHFMMDLQFKRMKQAANNKAEKDRMMFAGAAEQLAMDEENARWV